MVGGPAQLVSTCSKGLTYMKTRISSDPDARPESVKLTLRSDRKALPEPYFVNVILTLGSSASAARFNVSSAKATSRCRFHMAA
jgi:hypothetical protein